MTLAGGAGPRPDFPLATGQVWEMSYRVTGEGARKQVLTLENEARNSPDDQGARIFEASGADGAVMVAFPAARYLVAGIQEPLVMCLTRRSAGSTSSGYVLTGTPEALQALLPQRAPNDEYTDAEVYEVARTAGLGTCTLSRLR